MIPAEDKALQNKDELWKSGREVSELWYNLHKSLLTKGS